MQHALPTVEEVEIRTTRHHVTKLTISIIGLVCASHALPRSITAIIIIACLWCLYRSTRTMLMYHAGNMKHRMDQQHERLLRTDARLATGRQLVNMLCSPESKPMALPSNEALQRFLPVWQNTECLFARAATLWGSPAWRPALSLGKRTPFGHLV